MLLVAARWFFARNSRSCPFAVFSSSPFLPLGFSLVSPVARSVLGLRVGSPRAPCLLGRSGLRPTCLANVCFYSVSLRYDFPLSRPGAVRFRCAASLRLGPPCTLSYSLLFWPLPSVSFPSVVRRLPLLGSRVRGPRRRVAVGFTGCCSGVLAPPRGVCAPYASPLVVLAGVLLHLWAVACLALFVGLSPSSVVFCLPFNMLNCSWGRASTRAVSLRLRPFLPVCPVHWSTGLCRVLRVFCLVPGGGAPGHFPPPSHCSPCPCVLFFVLLFSFSGVPSAPGSCARTFLLPRARGVLLTAERLAGAAGATARPLLLCVVRTLAFPGRSRTRGWPRGLARGPRWFGGAPRLFTLALSPTFSSWGTVVTLPVRGRGCRAAATLWVLRYNARVFVASPRLPVGLAGFVTRAVLVGLVVAATLYSRLLFESCEFGLLGFFVATPSSLLLVSTSGPVAARGFLLAPPSGLFVLSLVGGPFVVPVLGVLLYSVHLRGYRLVYRSVFSVTWAHSPRVCSSLPSFGYLACRVSPGRRGECRVAGYVPSAAGCVFRGVFDACSRVLVWRSSAGLGCARAGADVVGPGTPDPCSSPPRFRFNPPTDWGVFRFDLGDVGSAGSSPFLFSPATSVSCGALSLSFARRPCRFFCLGSRLGCAGVVRWVVLSRACSFLSFLGAIRFLLRFLPVVWCLGLVVLVFCSPLRPWVSAVRYRGCLVVAAVRATFLRALGRSLTFGGNCCVSPVPLCSCVVGPTGCRLRLEPARCAGLVGSLSAIWSVQTCELRAPVAGRCGSARSSLVARSSPSSSGFAYGAYTLSLLVPGSLLLHWVPGRFGSSFRLPLRSPRRVFSAAELRGVGPAGFSLSGYRAVRSSHLFVSFPFRRRSGLRSSCSVLSLGSEHRRVVAPLARLSSVLFCCAGARLGVALSLPLSGALLTGRGRPTFDRPFSARFADLSSPFVALPPARRAGARPRRPPLDLVWPLLRACPALVASWVSRWTPWTVGCAGFSLVCFVCNATALGRSAPCFVLLPLLTAGALWPSDAVLVSVGLPWVLDGCGASAPAPGLWFILLVVGTVALAAVCLLGFYALDRCLPRGVLACVAAYLLLLWRASPWGVSVPSAVGSLSGDCVAVLVARPTFWLSSFCVGSSSCSCCCRLRGVLARPVRYVGFLHAPVSVGRVSFSFWVCLPTGRGGRPGPDFLLCLLLCRGTASGATCLVLGSAAPWLALVLLRFAAWRGGGGCVGVVCSVPVCVSFCRHCCRAVFAPAGLPYCAFLVECWGCLAAPVLSVCGLVCCVRRPRRCLCPRLLGPAAVRAPGSAFSRRSVGVLGVCCHVTLFFSPGVSGGSVSFVLCTTCGHLQRSRSPGPCGFVVCSFVVLSWLPGSFAAGLAVSSPRWCSSALRCRLGVRSGVRRRRPVVRVASRSTLSLVSWLLVRLSGARLLSSSSVCLTRPFRCCAFPRWAANVLSALLCLLWPAPFLGGCLASSACSGTHSCGGSWSAFIGWPFVPRVAPPRRSDAVVCAPRAGAGASPRCVDVPWPAGAPSPLAALAFRPFLFSALCGFVSVRARALQLVLYLTRFFAPVAVSCLVFLFGQLRVRFPSFWRGYLLFCSGVVSRVVGPSVLAWSWPRWLVPLCTFLGVVVLARAAAVLGGGRRGARCCGSRLLFVCAGCFGDSVLCLRVPVCARFLVLYLACVSFVSPLRANAFRRGIGWCTACGGLFDGAPPVVLRSVYSSASLRRSSGSAGGG
ncbi:hypothetical protein Tco_1165305 [Tanacetum coccineum]